MSSETALCIRMKGFPLKMLTSWGLGMRRQMLPESEPQTATKMCYCFYCMGERLRYIICSTFLPLTAWPPEMLCSLTQVLYLGPMVSRASLNTHTSGCYLLPLTVKTVGRNILSSLRGGPDTCGCQSGMKRALGLHRLTVQSLADTVDQLITALLAPSLPCW